jgi:predicted nucleotide-binding protein (sugar kinase/HSP70/actin superfamily)
LDTHVTLHYLAGEVSELTKRKMQMKGGVEEVPAGSCFTVHELMVMMMKRAIKQIFFVCFASAVKTHNEFNQIR